ncbi:MAG: hypothetical protein RR332_06885, partial [Clostridiales bacterium]
ASEKLSAVAARLQGELTSQQTRLQQQVVLLVGAEQELEELQSRLPDLLKTACADQAGVELRLQQAQRRTERLAACVTA